MKTTYDKLKAAVLEAGHAWRDSGDYDVNLVHWGGHLHVAYRCMGHDVALSYPLELRGHVAPGQYLDRWRFVLKGRFGRLVDDQNGNDFEGPQAYGANGYADRRLWFRDWVHYELVMGICEVRTGRYGPYVPVTVLAG